MTTLKKLIKMLIKKHNLNINNHFDVWICGFNLQHNAIDKQHPFVCGHFLGYKKYVYLNRDRKYAPSGRRILEPTNIFKWLEFEVEEYEFEIADFEYHLFVKFVGINNSFA